MIWYKAASTCLCGGLLMVQSVHALRNHPNIQPFDEDLAAKVKVLKGLPAKDPIVVLNGLGGASLRFLLRGAKPRSSLCRTWFARWHTAWLLPRDVLPPVTRCLMDYLSPVFDPVNRTYSNQPGVEVEVKGFGTIASLMNLGPKYHIADFDYIRLFLTFLTDDLGYVEGRDVFGSPFDWRFTPDALEAQGFFDQLKALVETAYKASGCGRVHLIAHSLGGAVVLAFLNAMDLEWKRTYVKSFVPVGGPFAGTVMNLLGIISGYNLGIPIDGSLLRNFEAATPTGPWLLPHPLLWPRDEVLVQTPSKNYSAWDYTELMADLGLNDTAAVYANVQNLTFGVLTPPAIDMHVVHSVGQPTAVLLSYDADFTPDAIPQAPVVTNGAGDGTVPIRSLDRPFKEWRTPDASYKLTRHTVTGVDHMDIINDNAFYAILTDILLDKVDHTPRPAMPPGPPMSGSSYSSQSRLQKAPGR